MARADTKKRAKVQVATGKKKRRAAPARGAGKSAAQSAAQSVAQGATQAASAKSAQAPSEAYVSAEKHIKGRIVEMLTEAHTESLLPVVMPTINAITSHAKRISSMSTTSEAKALLQTIAGYYALRSAARMRAKTTSRNLTISQPQDARWAISRGEPAFVPQMPQ